MKKVLFLVVVVAMLLLAIGSATAALNEADKDSEPVDGGPVGGVHAPAGYMSGQAGAKMAGGALIYI